MCESRLTGKELSLEPAGLDTVLSGSSAPRSQLDITSRLGHMFTALIVYQGGLYIGHDERSKGYIDVSSRQSRCIRAKSKSGGQLTQ
jgi:hypothetical protein